MDIIRQLVYEAKSGNLEMRCKDSVVTINNSGLFVGIDMEEVRDVAEFLNKMADISEEVCEDARKARNSEAQVKINRQL